MSKRQIRLAQALNRRNPSTVGIWGPWGIRHLLKGHYITPVPFTGLTYWLRRGEWRIFHISDFDLVD